MKPKERKSRDKEIDLSNLAEYDDSSEEEGNDMFINDSRSTGPDVGEGEENGQN